MTTISGRCVSGVDRHPAARTGAAPVEQPTAAPAADADRAPRGSAERAARCILIAAVVCQPILHPTGPKNSSPVDVLTISSIIAAAVWLAGTHRKLRAPYVLPAGLYMAAGAASGLVSVLPGTALTTLMKDALLLAWCLAVVNVLGRASALRSALVAWSWSGICWALVTDMAWAGHITFLEGLTPAEGNRVMFTFGDPNYASWYWDATIFVLYAAHTPARRWLRLVGYAALLWALALSESNGGVLALGVGVVFLLLVAGYRRHGLVGVTAIGLTVGLAVGAFFTVLPLNEIRQWAATSGQPLLVNSIGRSAQSSSERSLLIRETFELYRRSDGVLGLGPASTKPLLTQWLYPYANEAHDDYLAALVERGTLGLLAFLLLMASALRRAAPIVRRPLPGPFARAVPHPAGVVAAFLAVSVNSFYEEVQDVRFWWLLLGIVAVLGRQASRTRTPTRSGVPPARPRARAPAAGWPTPLSGRHAGPRGRGSGSLLSRQAATNLAAQGGALAVVSVASLLVARTGGPTVIGYYSLIRVLPWLFGVILSCGLPTASAFFLTGDRGRDRRVRPTLALMAAAGAGLAGVIWLACVVPLHELLFRRVSVGLVAVMGVLVVTQLWTVTAKACCQGSGDITGANLVIVAEELWFVPCYPAVLLLVGYHGTRSVVIALLASGALATGTGLTRLWRRGFFTDWGRPSLDLARRIASFGARGQLGNMLWLMNLRFDFILLDALAGPAVLGIYAVASKVAELARLAPTALNYVLYPRFARLHRAAASRQFRDLLPKATALTLALTPVLTVAIVIGLPIVYGHAFASAVLPAEIISVGLAIEGAAATSSAFLLGLGRPGLNSVGMGVGATITVILDTLLIPRYGALGGGITSAVTYLTSALVLTVLARRQATAIGDAPPHHPASVADIGRPAISGTDGPAAQPRADTRLRRLVDVVAAAVLLLATSPLLLLIATAIRLTSHGPVLYRQTRVGRDGELFTMLKFRSMVSGADRVGPLVTDHADPRVTRIGALLRATKLDELPQLVNVLRGDMTLIGPRPEVPRFIRWYSDEERLILRVRPGLTGPGQIFYTRLHGDHQATDGAAQRDPEEQYVQAHLHPKLAIDLDYLRRRGPRTDLLVLLHTVALLTGRGRPLAGTGGTATPPWGDGHGG